jgi:AcrR family transcriptional regulator
MKKEHHGNDGETAERLLDAAEKLFARDGYDGVGMRALACEANVNLGAATYHFGSKEALYVETFMRRVRPTSAEQLRLLEEALCPASGAPSVERIVESLLRPPFELGLKHPGFHAMIVRNHIPPPFLRAALDKEFEPNKETFVKAFCRALPGLPEDLVRLRTMFVMSTMTALTMHPTRHDPKSTENFREVIRFAAAGMLSEPADLNAGLPPHPVVSKSKQG